jgi:hypothetical protein
MVTVDDLRAYVGGSDSEDVILADCLAEAIALVDKYNKKYDSETCTYVASDAPAVIVDRCYLMAGADLLNLRSAPSGVVNSQFVVDGNIGTSPLRITRDPLAGVYKILGRWVSPF